MMRDQMMKLDSSKTDCQSVIFNSRMKRKVKSLKTFLNSINVTKIER